MLFKIEVLVSLNVKIVLDENSQNDLKEQASLSSSRPNPIKSGLLRPSAFQNNSSSEASSSTTIRPSVLKTDDSSTVVSTSSSFTNPFLNNSTEQEVQSKEKTSTNGNAADSHSNTDPLFSLVKNGMPKSNLFTTKSTIPIAENSGFVFGQNVRERVTGVSAAQCSTEFLPNKYLCLGIGIRSNTG